MKLKIDNTKIKDLMLKSYLVAKNSNHEYFTTEHILYSMLEDAEVLACLQNLNVNMDELSSNLLEFLRTKIPNNNYSDPKTTVLVDEVIERAILQTLFSFSDSEEKEITLLNLLLSLAHTNKSNSYHLLRNQIGDDIANKISAYIQNKKTNINSLKKDSPQYKNIIKNALDFLDTYCVNLNEQVNCGKIDPLIGRKNEVEQIIRILARRTKNNVVLTGPEGVGKTAIVEGLAKKIVEKDVPDILLNSTIFSLDIGDLMAGTKFRGELEERLKGIISALSVIENSILFIDEIHMIMGTGNNNSSQGNSLDIANLLKPALARGKIKCIGATTFDEYRKYFEKDKALNRRFNKLNVFEPSIEDSINILHGLKSCYEEHHGVIYTDKAIEEAVTLSNRYIHNKFLPDKAIDIIDASGARQNVKTKDDRKEVINEEDIEFEISSITKIPNKNIHDSEIGNLEHLVDNLKTVVFNQDEALNALTDSIHISRSGLREDNKTIGSYLFTGPSGVGKCLDYDQEITVKIPKKLYDIIKTLN